MVVQSSPSPKSVFVNGFLEKKFPSYTFTYMKCTSQSFRLSAKEALDGIILELKTFSDSAIAAYDKIHRQFKNIPKILVVTPSTYQWLGLKRKKALDHSLVLLSETKSLDYILQLPRFIEEVGKKKRLRLQNERLQRLVEKRIPHLHGFGISQNLNTLPNYEETIDGLISENTSPRQMQCGLKLKLKTWTKLRSALGTTAQNEVLDLLYRIINSVVRNSDRVLRSAEDEFMIFLSNTQNTQLARCRERLERALKSFRVEANNRMLRLPIQIAALDHLTYLADSTH